VIQVLRRFRLRGRTGCWFATAKPGAFINSANTIYQK
jgi:hypothetical protein